jgi:hypothetical protein
MWRDVPHKLTTFKSEFRLAVNHLHLFAIWYPVYWTKSISGVLFLYVPAPLPRLSLLSTNGSALTVISGVIAKSGLIESLNPC